MNINPQIVAEDLKEIVVSSRIIDDKLIRKLVCPVLYNRETSLSENCLYIGRGEELTELFEIKETQSILSIGDPPAGFYQLPLNLIVVSGDHSLVTVFNSVQQIFSFYHTWQDKLQSVINKNLPIEKFGEFSEEVFENPITLSDSNYMYLFLYVNEDHYKLPRGYKLAEPRTFFDFGDLNILKTNDEFKYLQHNKVPTIFSERTFGFRTLFQNIYINDKLFARILVDELGRKLTDKDSALIYVLAEYITYYFIKKDMREYFTINALDETVIRLIEASQINENKVEEGLRSRGWNIRDKFFCILVETSEYDVENNTLAIMAMQFRDLLPELYDLVYKNNLVLILNLSRTENSKQEIMKILTPQFRDSFLKAGISLLFDDFSDLRYYYRQAIFSLEIGKTKNPSLWYYDFGDYLLNFLILHGKADFSSKALCPQGLNSLIAYDREQDTDFVLTLRTFLDCNMNAAECIRKLYIHRNTFLYRIKRIEEITKMDLNNPDTRLQMMMYFKIFDLERF